MTDHMTSTFGIPAVNFVVWAFKFGSQIQSLLNEYDPKKHIIDVTSPDHPQLLERLSGDKIVVRSSFYV